jgi:hypothetical protein
MSPSSVQQQHAVQQHATVLHRIEQALLGAVALGPVVLLSFPEARGADATFGWWPLWLSALPLSAWAVARTLRRHADANLARQPSARIHRLPAVPRPERSGTTSAAPRRAA